MKLTKKFGAILFLLTAGSLAGTLTFGLFFTRTAGDGLYLIASQLEIGMLRQLQIHTLAIRDGQDDAREPELHLIEGFDVLFNTMENGGRQPVRPVVLLDQVSQRYSDADLEQVVRKMAEGLQPPPSELKRPISDGRGIWLEIREPLRTIAQKPKDDPAARAAYEAIRPKIAELDMASRLIAVSVGDRVIAARQKMLLTLAFIGGLSIGFFVLGLWFIKHYISRPIELVGNAARRIHAGDYSQRVPIVSRDEIASLGMVMNEMCAEVERSVEQYRELFENASDIIYTVSLDGQFLSVNRAGERIIGYPREEFLKMNLKDVLSERQLEISNQMMQRKLSGEQAMTIYPLEILRKDGQTVSLEVGTRLIYEKGKPVAVQGLARDLTERRRLEEQLWIAQKMEAVGRLAGGIAHEFGNVLTIISGYSALLLSSLKADDPLREEVEGIRKAGLRATALIRHLLGFSKGQVFRPKSVDLRDALADISDMLRRLIGEDVQLITVCDEDLKNVRFDPAQFEQVMLNFALNARDAMPSGGELRIEAKNAELTASIKNGADDVPAGSYVRLRVSDTGAGMPPEVLAKVFEPFFSTKERGTGLGLSTVYGIIHQCGGSIAAESTVGAGTAFTIFLPQFKASDQTHLQEERTVSGGLGTETILLVEDNNDVRSMVYEMLRMRGYHVIAAQDQQQAISVCAQPTPVIDLLLTDVIMPDMTGPQLVARVRPLRPAMRILYMSGYTEEMFEDYVEKNGPYQFIQKPLTPDGLAAKVREVLDDPLP